MNKTVEDDLMTEEEIIEIIESKGEFITEEEIEEELKDEVELMVEIFKKYCTIDDFKKNYSNYNIVKGDGEIYEWILIDKDEKEMLRGFKTDDEFKCFIILCNGQEEMDVNKMLSNTSKRYLWARTKIFYDTVIKELNNGNKELAIKGFSEYYKGLKEGRCNIVGSGMYIQEKSRYNRIDIRYLKKTKVGSIPYEDIYIRRSEVDEFAKKCTDYYKKKGE